MRRNSILAFVLCALLCCGAAFAAGSSVSGRVIDKNGKGVGQAVVFVHAGADDAAPAASSPRRATMDQIDKTFVPGVLPIVVGSEVRFPNHDQIHHHVYSFSRTKSFELPLYKGQDAPPVVFDKPGVVKVGCNIHDWMSAVILVLPTAHYAVTDADGRFTLDELPRGTHRLAAWHELSRDKVEDTLQEVGIGAQEVRIGAQEARPDSGVAPTAGAGELTFTLTLAPARVRPAMRGMRRDQ